MPMRDGAKLPTSIFFPENHAEGKEKYPCILVRHPLGKQYLRDEWLELLKAGYMLAVQTTRSSCDETGTALPYVTDGWGELQDGYDTVEWLSSSEWTNGKVATIGTSATGITELLMAPSAPPHLQCQYIEVATPSLFHYALRLGGQFRKEQVEGWLQAHKRAPQLIAWIASQKTPESPFWNCLNTIPQASKIKSPQLHVGGWYDIFLQGTIDSFVAAQENSSSECKNQHKLIIGPWAHRWKEREGFGEFPTVEKGRQAPYSIQSIDWLDYHMKGVKNVVDKAPPIQYYVMGPLDGSPSSGNTWKEAHRWPPRATATDLYLHNTGAMSEQVSSLKNETLALSFNPESPVPTVGGRNLFIPDGPKNLFEIEKRPDVVTFTTNTLHKDTEVTGRLHARFFVSHVEKERDLCCRLTDVYPDGKSVLIAEGGAQISPCGAKQEVNVDLWSTSMVFAKGHKIRLVISGSNFPAYEQHLEKNDSADSQACFTIHCGGETPSYITLPIVSETPEEKIPLPKIMICDGEQNQEIQQG